MTPALAPRIDMEVVWRPQPGPQQSLLECPIFEVFYGGARGGGKTDGSIGDWLEHSHTYAEGAVGVFFRRTIKQLEEVVARTKQIYPKIGAKYNEQKSEWVMPAGGRLKFRYIERDSDAQEYQGHSYTRVYVEEATNFPSPSPINLLRGTLRSSKGVPVGMRLTGNPGGPGHQWVKKRYITPAPRGWQVLTEVFKGLEDEDIEIQRVFIPSKLRDNALLYEGDRMYVARLRQSGSEQLVRAWLDGNWDIIDGAFFDQWDDDKNVLPASEWLERIPRSALRFRAFDWGYAKPFSVGWYAVSDGNWGLPREALVKYREWYGCTGHPNVGIRMEAPDVAEGIIALERGEVIQYGVADPSIFKRDGGPSIFESMAKRGCAWRRADNKREAGWAETRARIRGEREMDPLTGRETFNPLLYILSNCEDSRRVIPIMQHDEVNAEDLDTDGEDHAVDELRYACMSRPWVLDGPRREDNRIQILQPTMGELMDRHFEKRRKLHFDNVGG